MKKKEELCSFPQQENSAIAETDIRMVPIAELQDFEGHPFKVENDMALFELMQSIEKEGVIVPALARPKTILEEFDRVVFESIVEKVIVGEINNDGTIDPFKLTFVMKGNGNSVIPNAKDWFKGKVKEQADVADMVVDTLM